MRTNCFSAGVLVLLLQLASIPAGAVEPEQIAKQTTIVSTGNGPYYRLNLPVAIYQTATHIDLSDVRIRNSSRNLVPHAWLSDETTESQIQSESVVFYPVANSRRGDKPAADDLSLVFEKKHDGSLLRLKTGRLPREEENTDWIIDASRTQGRLLQARLTVDDSAEGLYPLTVEGSDDLRHWRTINRDGQIAVLKRPGEKIEKLDVDLHGSRARFLRLRWQDAFRPPTLVTVTLDSVQYQQAPTPLQWLAPVQASACAENYCDYPMPANTPLDSLRIQLSEPNTLASITVSGQLPERLVRDYPRRHHSLYVLRHKRQPPVPAQVITTDVVLGQTVVYRLKQSNGEVVSENVALDGRSYTRLRIQTDGPIGLLGVSAPSITVASTPRSLIFLGQGGPPFTLHWGVDIPHGKAISLTTLMPKYQSDKPEYVELTTVSIPVPPPRQVPPAVVEVVSHPVPTPDRKPWLWATLAAGLLLLVGMAWSLLRSMDKSR